MICKNCDGAGGKFASSGQRSTRWIETIVCPDCDGSGEYNAEAELQPWELELVADLAGAGVRRAAEYREVSAELDRIEAELAR